MLLISYLRIYDTNGTEKLVNFLILFSQFVLPYFPFYTLYVANLPRHKVYVFKFARNIPEITAFFEK
jgi:hypothetical protein